MELVKTIKENKNTTLAIILGVIAAPVVIYLFPFIAQTLWSWLIPDLFPMAVQSGLVAGSISWWTGFKIIVVLLCVSAFIRGTFEIRKDS